MTRSTIAAIMVFVAIVPIVYLLAIGPLCGLNHRGFFGPKEPAGEVIAWFYGPVDWAVDENEFAVKTLVGYVGIWLPPESFINGPNGEVSTLYGP
ncbi:hypothetical protein NA78x_001308 [Anatilimnocola sp. NA78]|uniref:hypothetical protein n=1 Tax=Anatilimnocola sp. NA78 TaxID=3415683 RepID=UPI003CE4F514